MNRQEISEVETTKFLGLLLTTDLIGNTTLIVFVIKYPKILALFSLPDEYSTKILFYHYIINLYTHT